MRISGEALSLEGRKLILGGKREDQQRNNWTDVCFFLAETSFFVKKIEKRNPRGRSCTRNLEQPNYNDVTI